MPRPRHRQAGESLFEFCDRLEHEAIERGRNLTNQWIQHVPEGLRAEFDARLHSKRDHDHNSALLELFVAASFDACNWKYNFVENGMGSRPDLEVTHDKLSFIVETSVVAPNLDEEKAEKRLALFLQQSARIIAEPRLRLQLRDAKIVGSPSVNPFCRYLATLLDRIESPPGLGDLGSNQLPFDWIDAVTGSHLSGRVVFSGHTGQPESLHLTGPIDTYWGSGLPALAERLKAKRQQHQAHNRPVLVGLAWNDFKWGLDIEEIEELVVQIKGSLVWTGPCHPWTLEKLSMELVISKNSELRELASIWPWSVRLTE